MEKKEFIDDGRSVVDMTFTEKTSWYESFAALKKQKKPMDHHVINEASNARNLELTKAETRSFTYSAILAALLVGAVFFIVFFLFILFCVYVWFR